MNGLQLSGMEASDMLDVIHFILEDDLTSNVNAEQVDAKTKVRQVFYREFYGSSYKFASSNRNYNSSNGNASDFDDWDIDPFDPNSKPVKPYVPPTDFDAAAPMPFGKVLDAPLG
jgi:hypothetical protein